MNSPAHTLIIQGRGLKRHYQRGSETVKALDGVDIDICAGEMVAILGPSGCGKTTLVNLLSCLDAPTAGTLSLDGEAIAGLAEDHLAKVRRGRLGFIFQKFHLIPTLTVAENVELPLVFLSRKQDRKETLAVLTSVGLARRADHLPRELSGGEMQRVAVARALITHPKVIIADEPTGNLDKATGDSIFALLRNLVKQQGLTVILTTHNLALADQADRIISLEDGRIVKEEKGLKTKPAA
jgi:ABC-type lipoprotein export system ATPase subunit